MIGVPIRMWVTMDWPNSQHSSCRRCQWVHLLRALCQKLSKPFHEWATLQGMTAIYRMQGPDACFLLYFHQFINWNYYPLSSFVMLTWFCYNQLTTASMEPLDDSTPKHFTKLAEREREVVECGWERWKRGGPRKGIRVESIESFGFMGCFYLF